MAALLRECSVFRFWVEVPDEELELYSAPRSNGSIKTGLGCTLRSEGRQGF